MQQTNQDKARQELKEWIFKNYNTGRCFGTSYLEDNADAIADFTEATCRRMIGESRPQMTREELEQRIKRTWEGEVGSDFFSSLASIIADAASLSAKKHPLKMIIEEHEYDGNGDLTEIVVNGKLFVLTANAATNFPIEQASPSPGPKKKRKR